MAILLISILSAVIYLCAAALFAYQLKHKTDRFSAAAKGCFFTALVAQSITIGISSVSTSGTLLQGPNILVLAAWVLAMAFAFFELIVNKPYGYGAFIIPVIVLMMLIAELMNTFFNGVALYNRVFYEWPLLVIHIACFFISIACFIISAVASGMLLYQQRLLKTRNNEFLTTRMPALSTLKKIAGRTVCIGMPFFTMGMLLGFVRHFVLLGTMIATGCQGSLLYLIPRIVLSLAVWIVFCLYIAFIYLIPGRVSSRTCSWLSIGAGIAVIILAILSSVAVI